MCCIKTETEFASFTVSKLKTLKGPIKFRKIELLIYFKETFLRYLGFYSNFYSATVCQTKAARKENNS